ncbi:MAG: SprB repeat-containing protein [Saprospirales bacterium]|nr:SprB repeat-containing protein [Saprospirales bacterium]
MLDTLAMAEMLLTCANEPVDVFGVPTNLAGSYSQTFTAQNGCDSVHTIVLTVLDTTAVTENSSTCIDQPVVVFGQPTTVAGTYSQTATSFNGCDSVHTVVLAVFDTLNVQEMWSICQGESVQIFGAPVSVAGTYSQLFASVNGCDSTHTVVLTVADTSSTNEVLTTCANEPVDIFGTPVNTPGTYSQTFQNVHNCDSTHTIQLTVLDTLATSEMYTICANESVDVFGLPTSVAGNYSQAFIGQNGCDSVHTIVLTVLDTVATAESFTICGGESLLIFGTLVSSSGTYSQVFSTVDGCDSTHRITLTVLPSLDISLMTEDACPGVAEGAVSATVSGGSPPYVYDWGNGPTGDVSQSNLLPGAYNLMVTDANGCILEMPFTIGQPAPSQCSASVRIDPGVGRIAATIGHRDTAGWGVCLRLESTGRIELHRLPGSHCPAGSFDHLSAYCHRHPGLYGPGQYGGECGAQSAGLHSQLVQSECRWGQRCVYDFCRARGRAYSQSDDLRPVGRKGV